VNESVAADVRIRKKSENRKKRSAGRDSEETSVEGAAIGKNPS
jgi:hypothetical protein